MTNNDIGGLILILRSLIIILTEVMIININREETFRNDVNDKFVIS